MHRRLLALLAVAALAVALPACGAGGGFIDDITGGSDGDGGGGGGGGGSGGTEMSASEEALALEVLELVNAERRSRGLSELAWHAAAADVAYDHGVDMDVRNYFSHFDPDGNGPGQRLSAAGLTNGTWGENIARGQPTPASVMSAWMGSDGHRANILNPVYTHLGVGVHDASGGPWWVQVFLR
jgi:uncharacterized protein YkwD